MRLPRIPSVLGAVALGGLLVASTYGAQAARTPSAPTGSSHTHQSRTVRHADHFQAPVPHRYGANGMRMGLHCETSDMS
jgi:hypothetical protein